MGCKWLGGMVNPLPIPWFAKICDWGGVFFVLMVMQEDFLQSGEIINLKRRGGRPHYFVRPLLPSGPGLGWRLHRPHYPGCDAVPLW